MKKVLALILVLVMALGIGVPVLAQTQTIELDIIMGGGNPASSTNVGTATINYDYDGIDSFFDVTIDITEPGWTLAETHVYIAESPPQKSAPGKFPYKDEEGNTPVGTAAIPDVVPGDTVAVAVHVELVGLDAAGNEVEETGWAQLPGDPGGIDPNLPIGKGANWATYIIWPLPTS